MASRKRTYKYLRLYRTMLQNSFSKLIVIIMFLHYSWFTLHWLPVKQHISSKTALISCLQMPHGFSTWLFNWITTINPISFLQSASDPTRIVCKRTYMVIDSAFCNNSIQFLELITYRNHREPPMIVLNESRKLVFYHITFTPFSYFYRVSE